MTNCVCVCVFHCSRFPHTLRIDEYWTSQRCLYEPEHAFSDLVKCEDGGTRSKRCHGDAHHLFHRDRFVSTHSKTLFSYLEKKKNIYTLSVTNKKIPAYERKSRIHVSSHPHTQIHPPPVCRSASIWIAICGAKLVLSGHRPHPLRPPLLLSRGRLCT